MTLPGSRAALWVVGGARLRLQPVIVLRIVDEADRAVGQLGEWRVEHGVFDAVAIDVECFEEGEVEGAARVVVGADVEPVTVFEQTEGNLEALVDELVVDAGEFDQAFGVALLDGERFLSLFEVGDCDCAGEVGIDQLLALVLDPA